MRAIVARVIPEGIPIHPVRHFGSRTVIQGSADQIDHLAVGVTIEPQGNLLLLPDGFDKLLVIWDHNIDIDVLVFVSSSVSLANGWPT